MDVDDGRKTRLSADVWATLFRLTVNVGLHQIFFFLSESVFFPEEILPGAGGKPTLVLETLCLECHPAAKR